MNKWFNIRGKKGLTASFIITATITLIAFTLITGSIMHFMAKAEDVESEILCQQSLALRANTMWSMDWEAGTHAELKVIPPMCQTIDKKVSGTEEEISEEFAYRSSRCWWMFGEGRYEELLHDVDTELMWGFFSNDKLENDCFMCYTIMVDEDELGDDNMITSDNLLTTYLNESHRTYSDLSYLDYIQSYGGPGRVAILTDIEPNKVYAVSYLVKNSDIDQSDSVWKSIGKVWLAGAATYATISLGGATILCWTAGEAATMGLATPICATLTASTLATGAVILGGTATSGALYYSAYQDAKLAFYESERDTSMIIIDELDSAQEQCFKGDLAGN